MGGNIRFPFAAAGIDPYDASASAPHDIVSFSSSFHGRTMGALALTYKQQYKTPFSPMIGGAKMVEWLNFDAVSEAVQKVSEKCRKQPLKNIDGLVSLKVLLHITSVQQSSSP